jgi:hypothetical protein
MLTREDQGLCGVVPNIIVQGIFRVSVRCVHWIVAYPVAGRAV